MKATKIMKYQETHPWMTFQVDLTRTDPRLWLNLGEAASKIEHLAGVPLRPSVAELLHEIYLAKGAAATTAIEGNTLTEEQVLQHVRGDLHLPESQEYLQQEVDNIVQACNEIVEHLVGPTQNPAICCELLCRYNWQVRQGLAEDEGISPPGKIRTESVLVGGVYRGAPAENCHYLVDRFCEWLNGEQFQPPEERFRIPYAIIKSVVAHLYMAWIHPFGDGNGRTARLLEFHLLLDAGVPVPAAHLLSDHYNRTRSEYYRQLAMASRSGGDILPFIRYATQGFVDGLRLQLSQVRSQQWQVSWENYVHEEFGISHSATRKRQRDLVLDLGDNQGFIDVSKIAELTPRLTKAYAHKTERTVQRDLNEIAKLGLIERRHGKVRAKREIILAFLPARSQEIPKKKKS
jgi:Fic family protein